VKGRVEQKLLKPLCKILIKKSLKKNEVMFEHNEDCVGLDMFWEIMIKLL
jgi:hypothetical protein